MTKHRRTTSEARREIYRADEHKRRTIRQERSNARRTKYAALATLTNA